MNIYQYWEDCLKQKPDALREYFCKDAVIKWHNTNECFTVDEFIIANCEYPGEWEGKVERIEILGDLTITVTHVYSADHSASFHVTSFIKMEEEKIRSIDEYWGDDGNPPKWRKDKHIGCPIKAVADPCVRCQLESSKESHFVRVAGQLGTINDVMA